MISALPSGPEWTDIAAVILAAGAFVVALLAWVAAKVQANMAQSQAADAQRSADAAKEQVSLGKDQLDVALRQLELEQKVRQESQEPYVIVDIQPSAFVGSALMIVIENTGPTVARNVRIRFEPEIKRVLDAAGSGRVVLAESHLIRNGIPAMSPGRRIEVLFDLGYQRLNSNLQKRYTVTVDCDGPAGPVETMTYDIDLRIYEGTENLGIKNLHDAVKELAMLRKAIEKLSHRLNPPVALINRDPEALAAFQSLGDVHFAPAPNGESGESKSSS